MEPRTSFKQQQFNSTKRLACLDPDLGAQATALATFGPEMYMGEFPLHLRRRRLCF